MDNNEKQKLIELGKTAQREGRQIDFKESFNPDSAQDWARIIKDIIAMANSGGGIILFGVEDDGSHSDFNRHIILALDSADLSNKISSYTQEDFSEFEIEEIRRKSKQIAVLIISGATTPIVFTKPGADITSQQKQKPAFMRGSVYFRHGAKSEPGTSNDIRNTINKILNNTRKTMFQGIRKIANIKAGDEIIINKAGANKLYGASQKVPGRIVLDKNAQSFRPDSANEIWPFRAKELVIGINQKISMQKPLTNHDILCIKKQHGISELKTPQYIWKLYQDVSPRYSIQFVEWLLGAYKKNRNLFSKAREYYKKSKIKVIHSKHG